MKRRTETKKKSSYVALVEARDSGKGSAESFSGYKFEQIEELKEIFKMYDRENTGEITDRELKLLLQGLGDNASDKEITDFKNKVDDDGNGMIDFGEFMLYMFEKVNNQSLFEDAKKVFSIVGNRGPDTISELDIRLAAQGLLPLETIQEFCTYGDQDNLGEFEYADFLEKLFVNKEPRPES